MEIILVNAVGLMGSGLLLLLLFRRSMEFVTHLTVFSAAWGLNIIAAQLNDASRPEVETLLVAYGAWWAFLAGSMLCNSTATKRPANYISFSAWNAGTLLIALLVIQSIGIVYEVLALGLYNPASILNAISAARHNGEIATIELPPIVRNFRWGAVLYVPLAFLLHERRAMRTVTLLTIIAWALLASSLRFTRAPLLLTSLTILVCWTLLYGKGRRIQVTTAIFAGGLLVITAAAMQYQLLNIRKQNVQADIQASGLTYLGGPLKAYESILQNRFDREPGIYSLDFINLPLHKIGIIDEYPGLIRPYALGPIETNIYTYLDAFTLDCGPVSAVFITILLGFLATRLHNSAKRQPNIANLSVYSYVVYACAMSLANNEVIRFHFVFHLACALFFKEIVHPRFTAKIGTMQTLCQPRQALSEQ